MSSFERVNEARSSFDPFAITFEGSEILDLLANETAEGGAPVVFCEGSMPTCFEGHPLPSAAEPTES